MATEDDPKIPAPPSDEAGVEVSPLPPAEMKKEDSVVSPGDDESEASGRARVLTGAQLEHFRDHFSLHTKTTMIRFRSRTNAARVIEGGLFQTVLEEEYNRDTKRSEISIRTFKDGTASLQFLRGIYTAFTILLAGFLFVFCLNVLLFLVLDAAIVSGAANANEKTEVSNGLTVGVILAIIGFVHGLSSVMVVAGHFVIDTWTGHRLAKRFLFGHISDVFIEWTFFTFFILIPVVTGSFALLVGSDNWWTTMALTWFSCVNVFFIIFLVSIVAVEVSSVYTFVKNRNDADSDSWYDILKRCILLRQVHNYSGIVKATFVSRNVVKTSEDTDSTDRSNIYEQTRRETISFWSSFTKLDALSRFFIKKEVPVRLHTIDDVGDRRPWLTKYSWSLEKVFCRDPDSRYVAIVKGPGALRRGQIRSSAVCSFIGTGLILLVFLSFLVWLRLGGVVIAFLFAIAVILAYRSLDNARRLASVTKDLLEIEGIFKQATGADPQAKTEDEESPEENARSPNEASEAVYLTTQYERINEPTELFCWIMLGLEMAVWYFYPLITLFMLGNSAVGCLFFVVASVSGIRYYMNALMVIEETGNMDLVDGVTEDERWTNQSRLNEVVEAITAGKARRVWVNILGVAGFAFLGIFLSAIGTSTVSSFRDETIYLNDFSYPPQPNDMRYQTCRIGHLSGGFAENSTMADFAFLAGQAYRPPDLFQGELDKWFGPNKAIDDRKTVKEFRSKEEDSESAVHFKLVRFPEQKLAMIVIRGTNNNWDMLADSQLWSAAALMQALRFGLPFGDIFTPIFNELVLVINGLQSESVEKVSFYKLTTKFANELKAKAMADGSDPTDDLPAFDTVQVTGHSLGGGLSMITGAQAGIAAIGLSGPNALISGRSFEPPINAEQLNRYAFNIIPNRDVVPMLDDPADQIQYIRCNAGLNDFIGCHDATRSLCELLYTCGSGDRPPPCDCVTVYGFPRPTATGDRTFEEACNIGS